MSSNEFYDYYELLQLSPNADVDTIERIFRHLAKKYHPDNIDVADNERFSKIIEAHRTLADPETRAGYDVKYQDYWNSKWKLASDARDGSTFGEDQKTRERLLSLLYVQRRQNMDSPGIGNSEIARLLLAPYELIDFHLWYLKSKGWVERNQSGEYAITATGVDQVEQGRLQLMPDRLIENHFPVSGDEEEGMIDKGKRNLLNSD